MSRRNRRGIKLVAGQSFKLFHCYKMQIRLLTVALITLVALSFCSQLQVNCTCDRTFEALRIEDGDSTEQLATFEAPSRTNAKPVSLTLDTSGNLTASSSNGTDSSQQMKPMHCLYKFKGSSNDRIELNFTQFKLRGDEPECAREYVDIYLNLKPEDNVADVISGQEPNGRFCTWVIPRRIISLHNMLLLVIHSELAPPDNGKPIFSGTFKPLKTRSYDQIGEPEPGTLCNHTIYSSSKKEGEFQSITYPGVYSKGLKCAHKFIGETNQRIRLEFLDLDVYSGGSHCPFDSIKVYDGLSESDPIINTICGSHRSLIVYSTRETLLVNFVTMQREAEVQNRGFSAYFEFSDKFYDINFIQGQNARHIRGSECDQRIVSYKGTSGIIEAPESKNHPNAICRYVFEGLQTSLDYEKVMLKFIEFDLKTPRFGPATTTPTSTTTPPPISSTTSQSVTGDASVAGSNVTADQCNDNYVRLYASEQKPDQRQDPNDYDYVFCSSEIPQAIESDAASLLMEYNSGSQGGYFKAEYSFIVDFRIPGIQASSTSCNYTYKSDNLKSGYFNSPRHPSWYINDMTCSYSFMTKSDEALLLQFTTFKMANSFNEKLLGINEACKGEDSVQIYELSLDQNDDKRVLDMTEIGTYCGTTAPGPILSFKPMRVIFKTNKEQAHYGFAGLYGFHPITALKTNEFVTNCGGHIHSSLRQKNGTLSSPETYRPETYEKRNHICSWNITARPNHRIALDFTSFELEGVPLTRGCQTASVRLLLGQMSNPIELCGTISVGVNQTTHQYVSEHDWLSLTFISTKQASGSNGFTAIWTEIKKTP